MGVVREYLGNAGYIEKYREMQVIQIYTIPKTKIQELDVPIIGTTH